VSRALALALLASGAASVPSVSPPQHRLRDRQPERLGGLGVDDQLEPARLIERDVAWVRAFKDLRHVGASAAIKFRVVDPVGHQPAGLGKVALRVNRW